MSKIEHNVDLARADLNVNLTNRDRIHRGTPDA